MPHAYRGVEEYMNIAVQHGGQSQAKAAKRFKLSHSERRFELVSAGSTGHQIARTRKAPPGRLSHVGNVHSTQKKTKS